MDTSTTERSPWLRQLPPVVVTEVRRRRGALLAGAPGRVLDLDTPGALTLVEAAAAEPVPDRERFDTIVCTCRLIVVPDLLRAAVGLSHLLTPGGDLHLIEPVNRAGTVGLVTSSVGALLPAVAGLHLARDVPAAVRATGLTLIDLERFTIPTLVWPLRRFVQARARLVSAETVAAESVAAESVEPGRVVAGMAAPERVVAGRVVADPAGRVAAEVLATGGESPGADVGGDGGSA